MTRRLRGGFSGIDTPGELASKFSAWSRARMRLLGFYLPERSGSVTFPSALHQERPRGLDLFQACAASTPLSAAAAGKVDLPAAGGALAARGSDQRTLVCRSAALPS